MQISPQTIEALTLVISGGSGNDPTPIGIYRSGPKLESYMRSCGVMMQVGLQFPSSDTRRCHRRYNDHGQRKSVEDDHRTCCRSSRLHRAARETGQSPRAPEQLSGARRLRASAERKQCAPSQSWKLVTGHRNLGRHAPNNRFRYRATRSSTCIGECANRSGGCRHSGLFYCRKLMFDPCCASWIYPCPPSSTYRVYTRQCESLWA